MTAFDRRDRWLPLWAASLPPCVTTHLSTYLPTYLPPCPLIYLLSEMLAAQRLVVIGLANISENSNALRAGLKSCNYNFTRHQTYKKATAIFTLFLCSNSICLIPKLAWNTWNVFWRPLGGVLVDRYFCVKLRYLTLLGFHRVLHERDSVKDNKMVTYIDRAPNFCHY